MKIPQWLFIACSKSQCPYQNPQDYPSFMSPYLSDVISAPLCFSHTGFPPFVQTLQLYTYLRAFAPAGSSACKALFIWLIPLPPSNLSYMLPLAVRLYFPFSCLFPPLLPFSALLNILFFPSTPLWCSQYLLVWLFTANSMRAGGQSSLFTVRCLLLPPLLEQAWH